MKGCVGPTLTSLLVLPCCCTCLCGFSSCSFAVVVVGVGHGRSILEWEVGNSVAYITGLQRADNYRRNLTFICLI